MAAVTLVDDLKSLRVQLSQAEGLIQALPVSRETALSRTHVQRAKMWLGQVLKELQVENPYPQSMNPDNTAIEPEADASTVDLPTDFVGLEFPEQKVKYVRRMVQMSVVDVLHNLRNIVEKQKKEQRIGHEFLVQAYYAAIETKMWLGQELKRIHHSKLKGA